MTNPLPPPRPRDRVRTIPLQAERLPDGTMRISSPLARGWAGVGRTPNEITRALVQAFDEVTIASYARAKSEPYDLDVMTMQVKGDPLAGSPKARRRSPAARRAAHPPELWSMTDDGRWRSPAGRIYGADTPQVQNVLRRRAALGMPVDTQEGVG